MRHEHDPGRLAAFRRQDIIFAIGQDDPVCGNNREFSALLWNKGIGNASGCGMATRTTGLTGRRWYGHIWGGMIEWGLSGESCRLSAVGLSAIGYLGS